MKPNKKSIINKLLLTMVFLLLVIVMLVIWAQSKSQNIVLEMKDGFENPEILEYYKQDIIDVETITTSKRISIKYYDTDLNEDGLMDKIVYISSPLHTGTHGDSLHVLLNEGDSYRKLLLLTVLLFEDCFEEGDTKMGEMFIMPQKTNGFHNIEIFNLRFENRLILRYSDGKYQVEEVQE